MIKANATVRTGGKTYTAGQTIKGLSRLDRNWMERAGYITETTTATKAKNQEESMEGGAADEF